MQSCRNCGHSLGVARPNYCSFCGQETSLHPPTLREFAQQFGGSYLAAEGALWRTLGLLQLPGRLTQQYLAGRRRHYVLPLRLYLTISLVAFITFRLFNALQIEGLSRAQFKAPTSVTTSIELFQLGPARAGMDKGTFFCTGLPAPVCARLQERFDLDPKSLARQAREWPERFIAHLGTAMFLLVPAFAVWLKLVYLNRRMRYTEHLVFALHLHAFWFLMAIGVATSWAWLNVLAATAMPVYALLALQRVYGGRWWATALRAAAQALLYGLTVGLAVVFVGVWSFLA